MDKSLSSAKSVVLTQQNNEAKIALAAMPVKEDKEEVKRIPFEWLKWIVYHPYSVNI